MRKKGKFINISGTIKLIKSHTYRIIIQFSLLTYKPNKAGAIKKPAQIYKGTVIPAVTTQLHKKQKRHNSHKIKNKKQQNYTKIRHEKHEETNLRVNADSAFY